MPALTPSFVMDFESNMSTITEDEYAAFSGNLWWQKIMRTRPTSSKRELVAWLIATAQIEDIGALGGSMPFADIVSKYTEYTVREAGAGLKLRRAQLEDTDGDGMDAAAKWSGDIGAYMAYWPQKKLVELIKNGHSAGYESYDSVPFFSKLHKVNPFAGTATFANIFTGAAASVAATDANAAAYPGAAPIDDSVTTDVAFTNLSKVCAYIRSIKMPNNDDPRFLRPAFLLHGPRMAQRTAQLTNAKFLAQAATGGAGSADVEALIKSLGLTEPLCADEFAGFESDTTYWVGCEQMSTRQLGGFVYVEREPFKINYYGPQDEAQLNRIDELEYHCKGRNVAGFGHPFVFFKVKAA
jgi:hypothetical protein